MTDGMPKDESGAGGVTGQVAEPVPREEETDRSDFLKETAKAAIKEIEKRDQEYTRFLKRFVVDYHKKSLFKTSKKKAFYNAIMFSYAALALFLIGAIGYSLSHSKPVGILVTLVAGILSELIAIPLVIAKYLFNPEEDANIHNLIEVMQGHDADGRSLVMKLQGEPPDKRKAAR